MQPLLLPADFQGGALGELCGEERVGLGLVSLDRDDTLGQRLSQVMGQRTGSFSSTKIYQVGTIFFFFVLALVVPEKNLHAQVVSATVFL